MTESAPDLPRRDIKPKIKNLTANYKDAPNIVWQHRIGTSAKRGPDYGWEDFHPDDSVKLNAAWASSRTAKVNIQDKWTVDLGKMLQTTNGSLSKWREVRRIVSPKMRSTQTSADAGGTNVNENDATHIVWQHRIGTRRGPDYGWEDFHPDDSMKLNAAWASSQTAKVNIQDKWTVDLGKMLQTTNGSLGKRREVRRIVRPKMSSAHAPVRPKTSSAHDSVVSNVKISRYCIGYR